MSKIQLYVTSGTVASVAKGVTTPQVSVSGLGVKGKKSSPILVKIGEHQLVLADTHCFHPKHQTPAEREFLMQVYEKLAASPDARSQEMEAEVTLTPVVHLANVEISI
jgi:hypothetical protein